MRYFAGFAESFYYAYVHGPEAFKHVPRPNITKLNASLTKTAIIDRANLGKCGLVPAPAQGPGSLGPTMAGRHPLMEGEGNRHDFVNVTRHAWNSPIPPGAFARISEGVLVSTPEFTFLQLARVLPLLETVLVGCSLCASYRLNTQTGKIMQCDPLCTLDSLREFLGNARGVRYRRSAQRALELIGERAESPQEVNMFLLASLPLDLGGSDIRDLKLNYKIEVDPRDAPLLDRADRDHFRIDMGVPSRKAGVEYLGKHHDLQVDKDRERQNALLAKGARVLQAKYRDITDPVRAQRLICQMCALMGREVPERTPSQEVAHARLLDFLFGKGRLQL